MHLAFSRLRSACFAVFAATVVIIGGGTIADIALATVPAALAQDQAGGQPPAAGPRGGRFGKLLLSLNLTDAQKSQIRAIVADARKQNQTVTDREQKRANMKAAYAKVDSVLTPAQRTQLHTKLDAMRADSHTPPAQ